MEFPQIAGPAYQDEYSDVATEEAINFYLEVVESGNSKNKAGFIMKRSPGIKSRFSLGQNYPVWTYELNGHIFAVIGAYIYDLAYNGSVLTQSGFAGPIAVDANPVQFAANPSGTQLGIYSAGNIYCLEGGVVTEILWFGVPAAGIKLVNQYFLILSADGDGFFFSTPGDLTMGDPLNFASAEASANRYVSMVTDHNQVWLLGDGPISQVFYNDPTDGIQPFKPNPSAVIPQGTGAASSAISFNNRVWWLGDDGVAYQSNGYLPERSSTHAIEEIWRKYPTISDVISYTVTFNGHRMWRMYFPSGNMTWECDTDLPQAQGWHKVASWDGNGNFIAHRGISSCFFDQPGLPPVQFVGDRANGKIYSLEPNYFWDDTIRVPCDRIACDLLQEGHQVKYDFLELNMQTGIGDGSNGDPTKGTVTPEFEPTISIWYSSDSGKTWSNEIIRSLGRIGQFNKRVTVNRFAGIKRRLAIHIRVSAACPVAINTAYLGDPEVLLA